MLIEAAADAGFSAYAPDLPGCVATGSTRDHVEREMRDAIAFHLEGLEEAGEPIPEPSGLAATYVPTRARADPPAINVSRPPATTSGRPRRHRSAAT
jgi:predicted RNase H-like HicB family nuclease